MVCIPIEYMKSKKVTKHFCNLNFIFWELFLLSAVSFALLAPAKGCRFHQG